jgi:mono/diheme cytochrome c family protein
MVWLSGCGGETADDTATAESTPAASESQPAGQPAAAMGDIDAALAAQGEALFTSKTCTACHKLGGGRLVGPDLAGVTARRDKPFIVGMIANPDSMLANDATAKQLLGEYFTPMTNIGVTVAEAEALYEYFRSVDAGGEQ